MGGSVRTVSGRVRSMLRTIPVLGISLVLAILLVVVANNAKPWPASAADTGFAVPGSYDSISGRDPFALPDNGRASDEAWAEGDASTDSESYYGLGFSVPSGATIDGIVVTVEAHVTSSSSKTLDVSLSHDGGTSWTAAKNTGTLPDTSDTTVTLGGSSDDWGYGSWTRSIINSNSFRVRLDVTSGSSGSVWLDSVQARVYYTESTPPSITEAATLYNSSENATETQMTPQEEYAVKVTVTDANRLDDLATVTVTIFYDSNSNDSAGDIPAADTQVCCVLTCTVGSTPSWSQNPSSSTTWDIVEANCEQPTLTATSGDFWFHFKPGKVATEATDWDVYVNVTDDSSNSDTWYDGSDYDMLWYAQISVSGPDPNWGGVLPGMDFADENAIETVTATYICNGDYDAAVTTAATWGSSSTLNTAGTPGINQFSLKAWSSDNLPAADLVTTSSGDCVIDSAGDLTTESGDTNASITLYLKLGAGFMRGSYSGDITLYIRNR